MTTDLLKKKQVIDVLQWNEDAEAVLAWRYPLPDADIADAAVLTVRQSQMAVFVCDAGIADIFGPGKYKLSAATLPLLSHLKKGGGQPPWPIKAELVFFSTRLQNGRAWRSVQPMMIHDKDFGMIGVRACGMYSYRIADPALFFSGFGVPAAVVTRDELDQRLHDIVLAAVVRALDCGAMSVLDMAASHTLMAQQVRGDLAARFGRYGIGLDQFHVASVSVPDQLQAALAERIATDMQGGLGLDKLSGVASGGTLASSLAAKDGLVSGVAAGKASLQAGGAAPAEALAGRLETLKTLLDKGLISAADYDGAKAELLKKLIG